MGSCAVCRSQAGAAASLFPVMLYSTLAHEHSLTIYNGATAERGLAIALLWCPIALMLALLYFIVVARNYTAKVRAADNPQQFN